ncbi:hypothetical protein SUGI_0763240 [Cryptomeria japonica]|uniref:glucan endo-1,3-beta-glucosidase 9 n=1 Tax=Cryptomeria japonica TaxID=3369 RepID=UPI0024149C6E|nr:glucan endo-1,3-beta-glucosidase 9 [Cryptomeria japonica]GLJ37555.1 hypothetical protein SUGI_0763240 [Cryptomeria japonica]
MASTTFMLKCLLFIWVSVHLSPVVAGGLGLGVNWGTQSSHRLSPSIVVNVLQANNITKVKLFDADPLVLEALTGTHINVMLGVPNQMLKTLSKSRAAARSWVHDNVTRYAFKGGVDIRYIAVGNEPFLASYKGQFQAFVLPAVVNIQQALEKANLANQVKVVVPCNADAYQSKVPSKGIFRPDLNKTIHQLVSFLSSNGSPFVVNIYPLLDVHQNKNSSIHHPFFENSTHPFIDGRRVYQNDFERILDSLETALKQNGFGQMPIIIGGIGWPTEGAANATISNAKRFNKGLINYIKSNKGTPLRPGNPPVETYIYSLLDEDQKSIVAGNFERHWGIFTFDGQVKYEVDLGQGSKDLASAENVQYFSSRWCVANDNLDLTNVSSHVRLACSTADCTALSSGGSCNKIGALANISYAFNSYYQLHNQSGDSCNFDGLGMITTADPSIGDCRFLVGISDSSVFTVYNSITLLIVQSIVLLCTLTSLSNMF